MITINDAYKIAKKENRKLKTISAHETANYFWFVMIPYDMDEDGFYADCTARGVCKETGEYIQADALSDDCPDSDWDNGQILREYEPDEFM